MVAYLVAMRNGLKPRSRELPSRITKAPFEDLNLYAVTRPPNAVETAMGIAPTSCGTRSHDRKRPSASLNSAGMRQDRVPERISPTNAKQTAVRRYSSTTAQGSNLVGLREHTATMASSNRIMLACWQRSGLRFLNGDRPGFARFSLYDR